MESVRWNVAVSPDTDQAVRSYILERAVEQAKQSTAGMTETEVDDLVDEAVAWARQH